MQITRDEARQHLLRGWPVLVNGIQVDPNRRTDRKIAEPRLPPAEAVVDYQACRHAHGLTRAGMAAILRNGGGVMIHGNVITEEAELPPDDVLAMGDAAVLRQLAEQQAAELARVTEEHEATRKRLAEAERAAAIAKPPAPPSPLERRVEVIGAARSPAAPATPAPPADPKKK